MLLDSLLEKQGEPVWAMLADFWAEIMLFIAPSDNVEGHEKILYRKELITQLWALLTHAGIVTRPKVPNLLTIKIKREKEIERAMQLLEI